MRYRVIGVMQSKGQLLGFDLDDVIYIPVSRALELFNREGLMEINIVFSPATSSAKMAERITDLLVKLHGREDFTLFTQEDMLETLDDILTVIKFAVGFPRAVFPCLLAVWGVLTIMTTSMRERDTGNRTATRGWHNPQETNFATVSWRSCATRNAGRLALGISLTNSCFT